MIKFAIRCDKDHGFEAWFRSSDDYEDQRGRGLVVCPACGSSDVRKGLMAPAVRTAERAEALASPPVPVPAATPAGPTAPTAPTPPPVAQAMQAVLASPEGQELVARIKALKTELLSRSEDVGARFAEEARRIHYGEAPERAVHGQASLDEARALLEEGVEIMPLPILPEERN